LITRHEREIADARRDRSRFGFAVRPKPFSSLERRRQRFLSTLLKEAEKLGYKVRGEAQRNLSLEIGRNGVEFTLLERIKQVRRPLTDEEKARYSSTRNWRQEKVATGELVFTLTTYLGPGLPSEWRDGERRLEEQIGDVLAVLTIAGPILEQRRLEAEEIQRRRWEEEKRRHEERERQDQDRNRWRQFVEFARLWDEARLAGNFLDELKKQSVDPVATYEGALLLNGVYLPAVMEVLRNLASERQLYEQRRWYRPFVARCEHLSIDVGDPSLLEDAQKLLSDPYIGG
jgi:hypothetical protein